jgi:hypothetical protein
MNQTQTYNRRDFIRNLGKGIVLLVPLHAIAGCGSKGGSNGNASAPELASNFTVLETDVDGLGYAQNGQPYMQTNARHLSSVTVQPKTDLDNMLIGMRLTSPAGKVDWQFYSPKLNFTNGTAYKMPNFDFPVKNGPSGSYKLEWLVKDADTNAEDTLVELQPNVVWNGKQVASTMYASEAVDYLKRLFQFGANPGTIAIVGDSAPASDSVAAGEVANRFINDAKTDYGYTSPVLPIKMASEVPSLANTNGIAAGQYGNNPVVKYLWDGVGKSLPAGFGLIETAELADGSVYLIVSGTDDLKVRQAARALAIPDAYNLNSTSLKVAGTNLNDIIVTPA